MEEIGKSDLKSLFNSLNSYLIILPPDPDSELVSSALGLHLSLLNSDKQSKICYSGSLPPLDNVIGSQELKDSVGNKNLHIEFDFLESDLEKVDYEVDHLGKFSIVVHPKENISPPDISKIKFSFSGASAELVIAFAISSLEELGTVYAQEKKFLDATKVLCVSNHQSSINFTANVFQQPGNNYAEIVTGLIQKTGLKPSAEASNNLIQTIYKATNNLTSPKVGASTFENLAYLLRQGGHIPGKASLSSPISFPQPPIFNSAMPVQQIEDDGTPVPTDWQMPKIFKAGQPS